MNSFLKEARKLLILKEPLIIIMGNESCDLDSAVCALTLAYFYSNCDKLSKNLLTNSNRRFLPIMNITRDNLPLKTEVTHFVQKNGVNIENLICRNEVSTEILNHSKCILVDHHVAKNPISPNNVLQIIDHRPIDPNAIFSDNCELTINEVGSCATLIANLIRSTGEPFINYTDMLQMLYGPIILDTINFSSAADKARPLDVEIASEIENVLKLNANDRKQLFDELVRARSDVSSLSALQLLSKDLKIISNKSKSLVVAIPGYPLLVEDFMQKENAYNALLAFGDEHNCDMLILMGMKELQNGSIRRDLGIIPLKKTNQNESIKEILLTSCNPDLELVEKQITVTHSIPGQFFEQKNVKASRKQILPLVQEILNQN